MSIPVKLRQEIARLEGLDGGPRDNSCLPVGVPAIDNHLPWQGLPTAGLHEVAGDAAALGFCAALLGRLAESRPDRSDRSSRRPRPHPDRQ